MSIDEYIDFVLEKLISFYDPQIVYLFGSQARNDANKDSDIDFLIIDETDLIFGSKRRQKSPAKPLI